MCVRGLLLLLANEQISEYTAQDLTTQILQLFYDILEKSVSEEKRDDQELGNHSKEIQFLASMPKAMLHESIMALQNLITISIISSGVFQPINIDLIEQCIIVLDVFHWVNMTFKLKKDQVEVKEFYNDAVNNNLKLKYAMQEWAKQSKIQIRNGLKISHGTSFNICSYNWILNPHLKTQMLHTYQELDWDFYSKVFLM